MRFRAQIAGGRCGKTARRAAAIEEAPRTMASETVSVLMLPARPDRRLQLAFQHSEPALLTLDGARMLHRQLTTLIGIADGRPPK